MTIAIIDKQVAQTRDRLDRAAAQIEAVAAEFKRHCYEWHVNQNKQSQAQIEQLRQERQRLVEEREALMGALAVLEQRRADAQQAIGREAAKQHFKKLHEQLNALEQMAGPLDLCCGSLQSGSMGWDEIRSGAEDPPLLDRCGECLTQLFLAARAIDACTGSDLRKGVSWPPGTWSRGHVADLRKVLEGAVQSYCGRLPPPSTRNFSGLITALVAALKAALIQHEQTTNREAA